MAEETKESSRSRLIADVSGTYGTRVVTMAFGLVTGMITARVLGPENRGIFALAALFPATVVTLSKFGQAQATVYFVRRVHEDVSKVVSNVLLFALGVGLLLVGGILVFREQLVASVLHGVPLWALLAVCPLVPILLAESYLYGALQATDRFRVYNTRLIIEAILTVTGMALVLAVLDLGLPGAIGVVITVRCVMLVWVVATLHAGTPIRLSFDVDLFRRMIRYGMKSHIQIIASHFNFRAGIYIVAYFLSPTQVAFYAIGARLAEQIMYLPQSLGLALFPRLAGSSDERIHEVTAMACRQTLVITAVMAAFLTVVGEFAITTWYGAQYAPAAVPLRYIAWGIVMMSMYVLLSRDFTSRDRQLINIVAAYVALVGNVTLNCYLVPRMGIEGAAIGTAISYTVAALVLYVFYLRESGRKWSDPLILQAGDLRMWRQFGQEFLLRLRRVRA